MNRSKFDEIINSNSTYCCLIVGTNGTGKSTILKDIVNKIKTDIIYVSPYVSTYEKENNILFISPELFFKSNILDLANSTIIFDDCKPYIPTNPHDKQNRKIKSLMIERRFNKIEIYYVFHGLLEVPNFLYQGVTEMILKQTTDSLEKIKSEISNFDLIKKHQTSVNSNTSKYYSEKFSLRN